MPSQDLSLSEIEIQRYEKLISDLSHNFKMKNAMHESALQVLFNLAVDKSGTG